MKKLLLLIGLGLFLASSLQGASNDLSQDEIESLLNNENVWYGQYYGDQQFGWIENKFIIHSSNKYSNNKVYEIYTKDHTATKCFGDLEITEMEQSYFFDSSPPYNILGYEKKNTENENLAKINGKRVKNDFELEYIENNNVRNDRG